MLQIDGVVVGAGILGLLTGLEISKKKPNLDLIILEKERFAGEHSSSRNSGVLHAGIYYPFNSLKRKFCIEGNKLWCEMEKELKLGVKKCGKYLVATCDQEIPQLEKLFEQANENKVENISWVNSRELIRLSKFIDVKKAFFFKRDRNNRPWQNNKKNRREDL